MVTKYPFNDLIDEAAKRIAADQEVEFVHAEVAGSKRDSVLRIYIDKVGGVNIDDCTKFSTAIEDILDAGDIIPWAYVLEVSSPGIERQLYSLADFARFTGKLAKIKTSEEIGGQKNFVGIIIEVVGDDISFDDRTSGSVMIPFGSVLKANLKIDLGKELKGVK